MPRCLMAKKWKYPWDREKAAAAAASAAASEEADKKAAPQPSSQESSPAQQPPPSSSSSTSTTIRLGWGPSSPTAGATAPSPPPNAPGTPERVAVLYNGYVQELSHGLSFPYLSHRGPPAPPHHHHHHHHPHPHHHVPPGVLLHRGDEGYQFPAEAYHHYPPTYLAEPHRYEERWAEHQPSPAAPLAPLPPRKSLAMCYTSTGAALSLPPKKKDIYRPYSLQDPVKPSHKDLSAAHAILDLSASSQPEASGNASTSGDERPPSTVPPSPTPSCKTVAYTYEAFFVSDGRSKRKTTSLGSASPMRDPTEKPKYTCPECGKQYATSSNLSRHKQTHRSLDSQSAKKCPTCGKAYVSMPALAMHVLTHNLSHKCDVCGKAFSRPWLLQGHLRSHTGEKPYGCAHCGKAFADRSNLRAHMQTHSAAKNFRCKRCDKSFALKSYLNKHYESACFKDGPSGVLTPPSSPGDGLVCCPTTSDLHLLQSPPPYPPPLPLHPGVYAA